MVKTCDNEVEINSINSDVIHSLIKFYNEITKISRKPNDYGTGHYVYYSEIHMIDFIGRNPGLNVSEISEGTGMSISAASQIIKKLCHKNFLAKERYKKEVTVYLTEDGMKLFEGHREYHVTLNQYSVFKDLEKYPIEFRLLLTDFMADYIADLPKY